MSDRLRLVLAVGALCGALLVSLWQSQNPLRDINNDFYARYTAGEAVADGESPYDVAAQNRYLVKYGAVNMPAWDAPPVIAAFRVLSVLPVRAASTVLNLMSYAGVGVIAFYVTQRARARSGSRSSHLAVLALGMVAILQTSPVRLTLALGQIDIVALGLVLLLGAWVPALALLKPQTVAVTAAAIFGRAIGLGWPPAVDAIRWRRVLVGLATSAGLVVFALVFARAAHWDVWVDRLRDRQQSLEAHGLVYLLSPIGFLVVGRGLLLARRAGHRIDGVCVAAGATALLAVNTNWYPQWFLASLIPLAAVVVPYLRGELPLDRARGSLLVVLCAATAGDGLTALDRLDPAYHWQIPAVALAGLLFAFWLLRLVPAVAALAIVVLNVVIVQLPIAVSARAPLAMAVAIGALFLLLDLRPSGLRDPEAGALDAQGSPSVALS